jgi:DNA-binding NarL/FixJ family response regulator
MQRSVRSRSHVVRVLVSEADSLSCELIRKALRPKRYRVNVVATATAVDQTLACVKQTEPDVAIVSARLQEGPLEGHRVLRELRASQSKTRSIILLDSRDRHLVIDTFRNGAHGAVFRDEPVETLAKCIHAVHRGQIWANSEHLGYLMEELIHTMPVRLRDAAGVGLLSKRQEEVAQLVSEGLTNKEVSSQLGLSEHTVRNYVNKIFERLGLSTRVELVLYCLYKRQRNGRGAPTNDAA